MNKDIVNLRKVLHKYPELSGSEYKTANRIKEFLAKHHPPTKLIEQIGGAGLAAVYEFPGRGKSITIRCELDALPIQEVNSFDHKSEKSGVSHKCGHDGHMAIVAGLIFWIKQQAFTSGKIVLLFQPAEETGKGAYQVIHDDRYNELETDYVFALHNIPGYAAHDIILLEKGFSAEVQSTVIKLKGKESHASEPEYGINPALGISRIIKRLDDLNVPNLQESNFAVLTPVHLVMGQKSYGISPALGELHYTIRTWSGHEMQHLKTQIMSIVADVCESHNLGYEIEWLEHFPASANEADCNSRIAKAARDNNFNIVERVNPFKFGEDFGWFSGKYKTAMFGLGAGINTPALHNADYDFPDEILDTGMAMFRSIIAGILSE